MNDKPTHLGLAPEPRGEPPQEDFLQKAMRRRHFGLALYEGLEEGGPFHAEIERLREECDWDEVSIAEDYPASIARCPNPLLYRFGALIEHLAASAFMAFEAPAAEGEQHASWLASSQNRLLFLQIKSSPIAQQYPKLVQAVEEAYEAQTRGTGLRSV